MSLFSRLVVGMLPVIPKPIVGFVAKRYVAGETLEAAIDAVKQLNAEGAMVTMDVLGESVPNKEKALDYVEQYCRVFEAIEREKLDCNVSTKPTMLGLNLDEGFCTEQHHKLYRKALEHGNWIRIDMEDHPYTDGTLRIYKQMLTEYGNAGTVLQSCLKRTLTDIDELPKPANIRVCKGIYIEPLEISWRGFAKIRENFSAAVEKLIMRGDYVAIATHDEHLVQAGTELVREHGLERDQYEFQMLLGVLPALRRRIIEQGHRLRVYVPFGKDWYPYSTRRLRENPGIAMHVMKAFLGIR